MMAIYLDTTLSEEGQDNTLPSAIAKTEGGELSPTKV
jgi:hypothetical protein